MKITKKELVKTAKELNELMGLDPAIPTGKDVEEATLVEKIGEAAEMLEEDDEISEVAQEVIDYIAELQEEEVTPEADGQPADEDDAEETTEQLVEKSDYKALKAMVAWYPEFEGIDIALYPAKKVEDLRARMIKNLAKKAGKEAPVTEAKEEKPAAKKDVVKVAGKAVPKVGFTNTVDAIVKKGGTWEKMVEAINLEATKAQAKPWAIGQLKAHVRFRTKKNEAFFGKLNMTEKGMF
jgi:hypothetical protein